MPNAADVYVATRDVEWEDARNGHRVRVSRGESVRGDCPGIEIHPERFEPYEQHQARVRVRELARDGRFRESASPEMERERGLRAIDGPMDRLRSEAADRLDYLIRREDPFGAEAKYLTAVANDHYSTAFGKILAHGPADAAVRFSREEADAVRAVTEATAYRERALNLSSASGGYAVPFELDPSILLTSSGATNPIRQIARVIPVGTDEWRGVSSAGVTASYAAEATETTDNAPTLAQPTISTEKAQAFIPFSIEVGMDWTGMQQELAALLQDAKDVLEAQKFMNGTGTNEPFGVLTGATNTVNAATGQSFTAANLYSLAQALPPRYRPRASWVGDLAILNKIEQFETTAGARLFDLSGGRLLRRPIYEASEMPDVTTTGTKFLLFGDFSRYVIIDRIGLSVELIPHLMGANRRPTGERGLYAYWRNGAKIVDANAFRVLIGIA